MIFSLRVATELILKELYAFFHPKQKSQFLNNTNFSGIILRIMPSICMDTAKIDRKLLSITLSFGRFMTISFHFFKNCKERNRLMRYFRYTAKLYQVCSWWYRKAGAQKIPPRSQRESASRVWELHKMKMCYRRRGRSKHGSCCN